MKQKANNLLSHVARISSYTSPSLPVSRGFRPHQHTPTITQPFQVSSYSTTSTPPQQSTSSPTTEPKRGQNQPSAPEPDTKKTTQAQLDEELRLKMEGLSGDGGASGVEYEDGQPVAMKRSVKNNMFRYI